MLIDARKIPLTVALVSGAHRPMPRPGKALGRRQSGGSIDRANAKLTDGFGSTAAESLELNEERHGILLGQGSSPSAQGKTALKMNPRVKVIQQHGCRARNKQGVITTNETEIR
jgi:hypothetical protein